LLVTSCTPVDPAAPIEPEVEETEESVTGGDLVVSRHVRGLNDQHTGSLAFPELTGTADDGNTGAYRAQLSPDGHVMLRYRVGSGWQLWPVRRLSSAVRLSGNDVSDFAVEDTLGPMVSAGTASFVDDNAAQPHVVLAGWEQLGVAFNPLFATRAIPIDDTSASSCALDAPIPASSRDNARYECLHLLVYKHGFYERPTTSPVCSVRSLGAGQPCVLSAPLTVVLDRGADSSADRSFVRAHLGRFRPIRQQGAVVRSGINELAVSGDGGLIFYVDSDQTPTGEVPDEIEIAYTFSATPYLPLASSPDWASTDWSPVRSLWTLPEDRLTSGATVRGLAGGLARAYPMAQYPFRFASGVRLRDGMGRYQWFSPEGSDMFVNIGSRAIAAVLGRETRGVVKHIDAPAQLTNAVYCSETAPNSTIPCDPLVGDRGNLLCSREPGCSNNGRPRFGVQEYTSYGTASGVWSLDEPSTASPVLPFSRRLPQRYMLFNNKALAFFNQDTVARGRHMWLFEGIANDDYDDAHFVAYFHMNEAIHGAPKRTRLCTFGESSSCDIEVDFPFDDPDSSDSTTADTAHGGTLGYLRGGAQLPFDYWASAGIGERVQGNAEGTGEVNPGYRGRAVRFPASGRIEVTTDDRGRLRAAKPELTVELAVRWEAPLTASASGVLVEQPGSWSLVVADGKLRLSSGTLQVQSRAALPITADRWHHLTATAEDGRVVLYLDGAPLPTDGAWSLASLPAATEALPLCIGPGCGASASMPAVWIDELGVSDVVRPLAYIKSAANSYYVLPGINAARAQNDWPKLVASASDYTLSGTQVRGLRGALQGLDHRGLRIPTDVLSLINGKKARYTLLRDLGRSLFHDPILSSYSASATRGRACSTCHAEAAGFASPTHAAKDTSLLGGTLTVNTPTTLNRAFSIRQFFDTRASDVLDQATGPVVHPAEMGGVMARILQRLDGGAVPGTTGGAYQNVLGASPALARPSGVTTYRQWFCVAFTTAGVGCTNTITERWLKLALATYELSLLDANSPVDRMRAGLTYTDEVRAGEATMSISRGYRVFRDKGRCAGCHSGSNYSDELRHQSGPLAADGRPVSTKTPTLRALSQTHPYFRDGGNGLSTTPAWCPYGAQDPAGEALCRVVEFYNQGACRMDDTITVRNHASVNAAPVARALVVPDVSCDPESVSLGLSAQESRDLVAFLSSL
jgi:cytochrome c peroxidase